MFLIRNHCRCLEIYRHFHSSEQAEFNWLSRGNKMGSKITGFKKVKVK